MISSLVCKLEKGTQARWYLYLTKDPPKGKEDAFVKWFKIEEEAGEIWQHYRMISAWCDAERTGQCNNRISRHISKREQKRQLRRRYKNRSIKALGNHEVPTNDHTTQSHSQIDIRVQGHHSTHSLAQTGTKKQKFTSQAGMHGKPSANKHRKELLLRWTQGIT